MECADPLIAAGRSTASATWRPAKQRRKAMNVIRADDDSEPDAAGTSSKPAEKISVAANDEDFRDLVKEKRVGCFRCLGGAAGLAKALASGAETGIRGGEEDIQRRRETFGANTFPKRKPKSFLRHVWDALSDVFLTVLLVCAAVSFGFGIKEHGLTDGWYDGVSIFLAVFLVAGVSALSNHSQARRFDRLARASDDVAVQVIRAARRRKVSIIDLVVGDVVALKIGDVVPADGVFLSGHCLWLVESSMTGEPHRVHVNAETSPFLASGVKVMDGYGLMLVTAVGTHTTWGEMMRTITRDNTNDPKPLQERLEGLTSSIGKVGVAVAVLVFAARHITGST